MLRVTGVLKEKLIKSLSEKPLVDYLQLSLKEWR